MELDVQFHPQKDNVPPHITVRWPDEEEPVTLWRGERRKFSGSRGTYWVDGGKTVILKLAWNPNDSLCGGQVEAEVGLWHSLNPDDRRWFAPILAHGSVKVLAETLLPDIMQHPWVLMKFIHGTQANATPPDRDIIERLRAKYGCSDLWSGNYIITPDGPVIVDYGLTI